LPSGAGWQLAGGRVQAQLFPVHRPLTQVIPLQGRAGKHCCEGLQ
jgi:hypothetical protein